MTEKKKNPSIHLIVPSYIAMVIGRFLLLSFPQDTVCDRINLDMAEKVYSNCLHENVSSAKTDNLSYMAQTLHLLLIL